jgi:hypothetical protein
MTDPPSLTPTIPFPALRSIILWNNAIMREGFDGAMMVGSDEAAPFKSENDQTSDG